MPSSSNLLAMAAAISTANAAYSGFNYGSTHTDGSAVTQSDFESLFTTAANLVGAEGVFTSARLYTMIQGGTTNDPISAIPAAASTKTSLLLGLWASAGDAAFANEIAALKAAISQYCNSGIEWAGISVGSEDIYRTTPTGVASNAGPGASPSTLVGYVQQVRDTVKGSCLESAPILHVDTSDAWVLSETQALIDVLDAIGVDTYPYYQNTDANAIQNGASLYNQAIQEIAAVANGKPLWTTETGWPVSGPTDGQAVASLANAQSYWDQVGCPSFGKTNMYWYTLQDADPTVPSPSFGIVGSTLSTTPLFDLSCKNVSSPTSSASSSATSKPTGSKTASQAASSSTHGSSSDSSSSAGSGSGSGSGDSSSAHPTTAAAAPFPSTNGTAHSGASPTGSGSSSSPSPSHVAGSSGNKLSSFGAAAISFILAFAAL